MQREGADRFALYSWETVCPLAQKGERLKVNKEAGNIKH